MKLFGAPARISLIIFKLKKQVEFMQGKCREAGRAILDLEVTNSGLKKEIDRLSEENSNLTVLLKGGKNGKR